jgi:ribosomal-protein-alanine N-acetyltransferase
MAAPGAAIGANTPLRAKTPLALRFEPVGRAHLDGLVALFERNAIPAVTALFDPFPLNAAEARRIALEPRQDAFYLAASGELLLGFSMLRGFDEGYEIPSFGIFVDHESHGQGIGRELTAWTIEQARQRGCPAVRLTVYAGNSAARQLYESLGFLEQERHLSHQNKARPDEKIVMRLDFND